MFQLVGTEKIENKLKVVHFCGKYLFDPHVHLVHLNQVQLHVLSALLVFAHYLPIIFQLK